MRSANGAEWQKKVFAFDGGFRKLKSHLSGLIFAVTLKGGAVGTIFNSIGQMTIFRNTG
ncbi:hypothetical protein KCA24_33265 [Escherichia coli]|nr:hypothetical protein [Escherichia coli]